MNLYEELSKILGTYVTRESLDRDLKVIDSSGAITQKKLFEIIVLLVKYVDEQTSKRDTDI